MRLPDFIGIGALKAGTTYLDELLRTHPELCLPRLKEVDFFTRHYDRGPEWYSRQFGDCDGRLLGEVSPDYLADDRCPSRIRELLPGALLLASVRDPVLRAYSQYKHWVQVSAYRGDFEQFLGDHPNAIKAGRYFHLLSPYLDAFGAARLHIIVFEDLVTEPAGTMREVFAFLGVDAGHRPPPLEAANVSRLPRFPRTYAQAKRASEWLHRHRGGPVVDLVKRAGGTRVLFSEGSAGDFASLNPATAARLGELYRDDVEMLSKLLNRDLRATWASIPSA